MERFWPRGWSSFLPLEHGLSARIYRTRCLVALRVRLVPICQVQFIPGGGPEYRFTSLLIWPVIMRKTMR
jgi:hypothetical protein